MSVSHNLARIKETLGNRPITLVAVSKNASIEQIEEAFQSGVTEFGENRVQDALSKRKLISHEMSEKINWHFIGHLQTNKVKNVVGNFALIHSVDSFNLANEISKQAQKNSVTQPILLQVKLHRDDNKGGFTPEEIKKSFKQILSLPNISIEGLMTMAPFESDTQIWRQCFNGLKALRDELESTYGLALKELSMGMSQDYQEALACGSTMIRLGQAIFGINKSRGG
jgi:pyridoxal phosphate enzyme (YggS family)